MDRHFDRDTYLNKEKYDAAVEEENKRKDELISQEVESILLVRKYSERQWKYFRDLIKIEIEIALSKNNGVSDDGLELMNGLAEEFYNKFLVSFGVRNAPGVTDEMVARRNLKSRGLI